jgi:hypothetical protein
MLHNVQMLHKGDEALNFDEQLWSYRTPDVRLAGSRQSKSRTAFSCIIQWVL